MDDFERSITEGSKSSSTSSRRVPLVRARRPTENRYASTRRFNRRQSYDALHDRMSIRDIRPARRSWTTSRYESPENQESRPFDRARIEETLELTNEEKVVQLHENCNEFESFLLKDHDKESIALLLKLFSRLRSDGPRQPTQTVVSTILNSNIHRQLIDFLQAFVGKSDDERRHLPAHLKNCLKMVKTLLAVAPELALRKISTTYTIAKEASKNIAGFGMDGETLLLEVDAMIKDATEKLKSDKERKASMKTMADLHDEQPPDDIKEISVFPQPSDIVRETAPYLRTNLIDKPYRSSKHYIDVQFRLLREDFIRPLRDGLSEIRLSQRRGRTSEGRNENVKIYERVRILFAKPGISGIEHKIQIDVTKFRRVRWQNTKRLLNGNLLCLSSDNFHNDFVFAIVSERCEKELSKGRLQVHLVIDEEKMPIDGRNDDEPQPEELLIDEDRIYTMVETDAYYESYRHTLAGMKEMNEIPLARYIVRCKTDVEIPDYLNQEHTVYYDFRPLITAGAKQEFNSEPPVKMKREGMSTVAVLSDDWPPYDMLGLNQSQAHALWLALTHEFVVIQGPPGTGKTHVGLAIMKILLNNKIRW